MDRLYLVIIILGISLISYFIGGIPTALIFSKIKGVDIRKYGSHNLGGTNAGRVLGKKYGISVMVIDIFKCFIPCLIVALVFTLCNFDFLVKFDSLVELLVSITGLACCIGHVFTPFGHFKGGKAVACFAGYILLVSPLIALVGMIIFFTCLKFAKRVSVGSILGVPCCFLVSFIPMILDLTVLNDPNAFNGGMYFSSTCMIHLTYITTISCFLLSVLVIIRHMANIKRLSKGEEPETHFKKN